MINYIVCCLQTDHASEPEHEAMIKAPHIQMCSMNSYTTVY